MSQNPKTPKPRDSPCVWKSFKINSESIVGCLDRSLLVKLFFDGCLESNLSSTRLSADNPALYVEDDPMHLHLSGKALPCRQGTLLVSFGSLS